MIPAGRMSRVRCEATTSPRCAFRALDRLQPVVGSPLWSECLRPASPLGSAAVFCQGHLDPASLPVAWCTHRPFASEALPAHPRSDGLMCQPCCLPATRPGGSCLGLGRLDHSRLVSRTFSTFSLRIFPCVLGPLPRPLGRCPSPVLPPRHRPAPVRTGSALSIVPSSAFGTALSFGAAVIPCCSGPSVCSPPRSLLPLRQRRRAAVTCSVRASRGSFPPHAPAMLAVRIGPLTAGALHPIRCAALSAALHRGRTAGSPTAPAQIPACGVLAPGSSEIRAAAGRLRS
jgi:hypothetical protein